MDRNSQKYMDAMKFMLETLERIYHANFSTDGLIEGNQNFDTGNNYHEALNMLIEACLDNRIPEETHGIIVSATTLFYAYAKDNKIPCIANFYPLIRE